VTRISRHERPARTDGKAENIMPLPKPLSDPIPRPQRRRTRGRTRASTPRHTHAVTLCCNECVHPVGWVVRPLGVRPLRKLSSEIYWLPSASVHLSRPLRTFEKASRVSRSKPSATMEEDCPERSPFLLRARYGVTGLFGERGLDFRSAA
jgi:hypothetical protein